MPRLLRALLRLYPPALRRAFRQDLAAAADAEWRRRPSARGRTAVVAALLADIARSWARAAVDRDPRLHEADAGTSFAGAIAMDVRHTLRVLRRSPGHVATVVISVGVGLAASTVVFSIVNALFYRDLPGIDDRGRLVRVRLASGQPGAGSWAPSTTDVQALRSASAGAVAGVAAEGDLQVAATIDGATISTTAAFVSGGYFRLLGTRPALGRLIAEGDDRPGAPAVAVLSHVAWRQRFAGRRDVVGRSIAIGGRPATVIGVTVDGFGGLELSELGTPAGSRLDFWLPLSAAEGLPGTPAPNASWHAVVARLADGEPAARASAELTAAIRALPPRDAAGDRPRVILSPLNAGAGDVPADVLVMIALFLAVPITVVAIGCANAANLQLARATGRAREIQVRASLGASRAAIVRLLVMEVVVLASLAGLVSLVASFVIGRLLVSFIPLPIAIDWRVALFSVGLLASVVALAGVAPAWLAARRSLASGQRGAADTGGLEHARLRRALVAAQMALSVALLALATLFTRSLEHFHDTAPDGLDELVVGRVDLDVVGYDAAARTRFIDAVTTRMAADGRVTGVAVHSVTPVRYRVTGAASHAGDEPALARFVSPAWFALMGARPTVGRIPGAGDERLAAVVNERMEARLSGAGTVIGRRLTISGGGAPPRFVEIVGVIPNERRPPDPHDDPAIYMLLGDSPPAALSFVIRTPAAGAALASFRAAAAGVDARVPWTEFARGTTLFERDVSPIRYLMLAAGGLGLVALLLAASGIYAVTSYAVSLRRKEIGVRMAVGARPSDIARMILGESARVTAVGIVAGLGLGVPAFFTVRFLFVGVSPLDPWSLAAPAVMLVVSAIGAAGVPARRAARVDPVQTLRDQG
jgi:predicted permease